jgi:SAM-dependent methyltransferase
MDPRQYAAVVADDFRRIFNGRWYYSIELEDGVFTKGHDFYSIGLTRLLLSRCEVEGLDCLDVAAADGLIPILFARRGARSCVASDRNDFSDNIERVKKNLSIDLEYHPELTQSAFVTKMRAAQRSFDLIVNSGLLYHVFSPMHSLACSRSLLRTGGILILETGGTADDAFTMRFNAKGHLNGSQTNYWYPSVRLIDYVCRMFRLKPIDAVFGPVSSSNMLRFCLALRAVEDYPTVEIDRWIERTWQSRDYMDYISWDILDKHATKPVRYNGRQSEDDAGFDAWHHFKTAERYVPDLENIRLSLGQTM